MWELYSAWTALGNQLLYFFARRGLEGAEFAGAAGLMAFAATGIGGLGEYGVETRNGFDVWDEDHDYLLSEDELHAGIFDEPDANDDDVLEETELDVGLIE